MKDSDNSQAPWLTSLVFCPPIHWRRRLFIRREYVRRHTLCCRQQKDRYRLSMWRNWDGHTVRKDQGRHPFLALLGEPGEGASLSTARNGRPIGVESTMTYRVNLKNLEEVWWKRLNLEVHNTLNKLQKPIKYYKNKSKSRKRTLLTLYQNSSKRFHSINKKFKVLPCWFKI